MNRATFTMCGGMIGSHVYTDCKSFDGFFDDYFFYGVEKYIRDDFNTFMNGNSKAYTFDTYIIVLEYLMNKTNYPINLDTVSNGDTFNSIIQYVIDNNMVDDVISYMKDITYDFLYESFDTYLKSKTVFTLSKDSYYENGLLGVVKVDLDKVCTVNNLRFCHGVSDSLDIDKYMDMGNMFDDLFARYKSDMEAGIYHHSFREIDSDIVKFMVEKYPDMFDLQTLMTQKGFDLAIQYIKDNSLQDDFFEYIRIFFCEKVSNYIQCLLKGNKTLNVTKDVYFKDNTISFARMNFKDMCLYVYEGGYFTKVTLSSRSNHVGIYDISDLIKMTKSTSNLMFKGIKNLFPNLEDK